MDAASKRLIFQVVINDAQGNFKLGKADLPDDVKAKLDRAGQQTEEPIPKATTSRSRATRTTPAPSR